MSHVALDSDYWKVGMATALAILVALHAIAIYRQASVAPKTVADMGAGVQSGFIHHFARFLQYIIPAGLLNGTTVGYFKQRQSGALFVSESSRG